MTFAFYAGSFHADYAVTKGGLISLTKSLSSELASDGIYVNGGAVLIG